MNYSIRRVPKSLGLQPDWKDPAWKESETAEISHFLPESSGHRPRTLVRLVYDQQALHGIFHVDDQYVRCVRTEYLDEVWKDSCVEFFAEPKPGQGYFNFEFNCGGAFLCCHIVNPERVPGGFKEYTRVPAELAKQITVRSSLAPRIDPEIVEPLEWSLRFRIPFALFEHYLGPLGKLPGQVWRGNFFKCAEELSHPHWAAWSPVDRFDFHRPQRFGRLEFC